MKQKLAFLSVVVAFFLTACGQQQTNSTVKPGTATIQVTVDNKTSSQEVVVEQGDSVMDALEDYYDVEDEAGLVTVINGVSQDPSTNTYWMYKINGEMASKGAEEQLLAVGDTVEFYLETFK